MNAIDILQGYFNIGEDISNENYIATLKYEFYDEQKFGSLMSAEKMMKVYWYEILARAHWASIASIQRNHSWMKALLNAFDQNNYLAFSGALRSLIESCGDSMTSLKDIPRTLAKDAEVISVCLKGNAKKMFTSPELEDRLIHFLYARKISKEDKKNNTFPESHLAKFTTHYLTVLDNGMKDGPVMQLYSELCQLSHPAAPSILYSMNQTNRGDYQVLGYNSKFNRVAISELLSEHGQAIIQVCQYGYNNSLVLLKLLNYFNRKDLETPQLRKYPLSDIEIWQKIKRELKKNVKNKG